MQIANLLAAVLLLAGFFGPARADETPSPEALQTATELTAIISPGMTNQLVSQMTSAVWPAVEQKVHAQNVDGATIAELRKEFELIEANFVSDAMKDAPRIYAKYFTAAELRDLIAFYRTPTGAKALSVLPVVMGEFSAQLFPRLQGLNIKINEAFGQILRAHGYAK